MSFLKLNGSVCVVLVALTMLVASSQSAFTDTTKLVCNASNTGSLGPDIFEINEANHTVTTSFSDVRYNSGQIGPARDSGTFPATFTPDTITMMTIAGPSYPPSSLTYVINRLTGTVELTQVYTTNNWTSHVEWTCQIGKAKF